MDGVGIKGIKLKLKKRSLIAWIVCIAVCIVAFSATLGYSALEYAEYCEAQDVAIATTISILPEFKKYDIEYFFYVGGNDSMDTCYKMDYFFKQVGYNCKVIGLPKTVDNDWKVVYDNREVSGC